MQRRDFLSISAALAPAALGAPKSENLPQYRIVSAYAPAKQSGMPGPYPGKVVRVHSEKVIDIPTEKVDPGVVEEMMRRGMLDLTGEKKQLDAWRRFIDPKDVVGIKVNCSGAPGICSHPVVVAETIKNVIACGVPAKNITIYERFKDQMDSVSYDKYVPEGVVIHAATFGRNSLNGYDPRTYVDVDFFGEDDTRSNMVRLISEQFTKIINIPNLKDHGASGVTGCLKNIAYGSFHNVARSHKYEKTNTYSFIGTLATVEPLRSRTVLQVMEGTRAVWHGGPFSPTKKFRFYPNQMLFGTDPVAMDRIMMDVIEDKRKQEGALSVWDRSKDHIRLTGNTRDNPNLNRYIREPGHIEYASSMGLGIYDKAKIDLKEIRL